MHTEMVGVNTIEPETVTRMEGTAIPKKLMLSSKFPVRLYRMLEVADPDIIGWLSHGRAFQVKNHDLFVSDLLRTHFRQTKFQSFRRILNLYGFKLIIRGPDKGAYYNKYFQRDHPELLFRIVDRLKSSSGSQHTEDGTKDGDDSVEQEVPEVEEYRVKRSQSHDPNSHNINKLNSKNTQKKRSTSSSKSHNQKDSITSGGTLYDTTSPDNYNLSSLETVDFSRSHSETSMNDYMDNLTLSTSNLPKYITYDSIPNIGHHSHATTTATTHIPQYSPTAGSYSHSNINYSTNNNIHNTISHGNHIYTNPPNYSTNAPNTGSNLLVPTATLPTTVRVSYPTSTDYHHSYPINTNTANTTTYLPNYSLETNNNNINTHHQSLQPPVSPYYISPPTSSRQVQQPIHQYTTSHMTYQQSAIPTPYVYNNHQPTSSISLSAPYYYTTPSPSHIPSHLTTIPVPPLSTSQDALSPTYSYVSTNFTISPRRTTSLEIPSIDDVSEITTRGIEERPDRPDISPLTTPRLSTPALIPTNTTTTTSGSGTMTAAAAVAGVSTQMNSNINVNTSTSTTNDVTIQVDSHLLQSYGELYYMSTNKDYIVHFGENMQPLCYQLIAQPNVPITTSHITSNDINHINPINHINRDTTVYSPVSVTVASQNYIQPTTQYPQNIENNNIMPTIRNVSSTVSYDETTPENY